MKNGIQFLSFILMACIFPTVIDAKIIDNNTLNYTLETPQDWKELSQQDLDTYSYLISESINGQINDYVAGFQLFDKEKFEYPYILIQHHNMVASSYNQIQEEFDKYVDMRDVLIDEGVDRSVYDLTTISKPELYKEKNMIIMDIEMYIEGKGIVKGKTAQMLGKDGIVEIDFYALKREYEDYIHKFDELIESFNFKSGYKFKEKKLLSQFNYKTLLFALIGGGVLGLFEFFLKKKKRAETSK